MLLLEHLIILTAALSIAYLILNRWKNRKLYELANKLPGINGMSLIDSIYMLVFKSSSDCMAKVFSYLKSDTAITKIWLGNNLLILSKDAGFINKVFNSPFTFDKPDMLYQGFSFKGLFTMNGDEYKRARKILNRGFTPKILQHLPEIFDKLSQEILNRMEEKLNDGEFDLTEYVGAFTLNGFGKSQFNYDIDCFRSEIYHAQESYMSLTVNVLKLLVLKLNRKIINVTNFGKIVNKNIEVFYEYARDVINLNQLGCDTDSIHSNVIDILLDPDNKFYMRDIEDQIILFLLGVFDTTTKTISTVLMLLGMYKDIQQKLIEEIENVFNENEDTKFSIEFLQKFSYLEKVIKETLRIFPVVPYISRKTTEEVEIEGYLLPKDAIIVISITELHRNEKYWGDDARVFRPERFEEELKNPNAFAPFLNGRRMCIGSRYAMISMKIFLINFFRKFVVDCSSKIDEIKTETIFVLNFVDGYKVSIRSK